MVPPATPHAPFGANASFDFGPPGAPAGFALPAGTAVGQNVFVGCRSSAREPWSLLPFFTPTADGPQPLPKGRFGRFLAWAGDKWMIGPLVFKLCTPFSLEPGDEPFRYAPVICGYLEYDNTHSADTAELIFGLGGPAEPLVSDKSLVGFSFGNTHGFATTASSEIECRSDADLFETEIGPAAALHVTVPPHAKRIHPLVLGVFQAGFHYAQFFTGLSAALSHGLAQHSRYLALADARDSEFMRSSLDFDAKVRAAQEIRAWLAHTRRLTGEPEIDLTALRSLMRSVVPPA